MSKLLLRFRALDIPALYSFVLDPQKHHEPKLPENWRDKNVLFPPLPSVLQRRSRWMWKARSSPMESWTVWAQPAPVTWMTTAACRAWPATRATPPAVSSSPSPPRASCRHDHHHPCQPLLFSHLFPHAALPPPAKMGMRSTSAPPPVQAFQLLSVPSLPLQSWRLEELQPALVCFWTLTDAAEASGNQRETRDCSHFKPTQNEFLHLSHPILTFGKIYNF